MKKIMLLLGMLTLSMAQADRTLDELDALMGGEPNVRVNLGPQLLSLASQFSDGDEEVEQVLEGLKNLSINVYELDSKADDRRISDWLADSVKSLTKRGVSELVKVVDDGEQVHIFARVENQMLHDLSIMVYEAGDEFVYITMNGYLDVKNIGDLAGKFDVDLDMLEDLSINL